MVARPSGELPRAGEPTETNSCDVIRPVPEALRLRHVMRPSGIDEEFYDKFTEAYGIPVVGKSTQACFHVLSECLELYYIQGFYV